MNPSFEPAAAVVRQSEPSEANIRELVYAFYDRVRADALLGPVFEQKIAGRWDEHLPKMCLFWGSLVLGWKQYRGNVQQTHQPLEGLGPAVYVESAFSKPAGTVEGPLLIQGKDIVYKIIGRTEANRSRNGCTRHCYVSDLLAINPA